MSNTNFITTRELSGISGIPHTVVRDAAIRALETAGISHNKFWTDRKTFTGRVKRELDLPESACMVAVIGSEIYTDAQIDGFIKTFRVLRKEDEMEHKDPVYWRFLNGTSTPQDDEDGLAFFPNYPWTVEDIANARVAA